MIGVNATPPVFQIRLDPNHTPDGEKPPQDGANC